MELTFLCRRESLEEEAERRLAERCREEDWDLLPSSPCSQHTCQTQ